MAATPTTPASASYARRPTGGATHRAGLRAAHGSAGQAAVEVVGQLRNLRSCSSASDWTARPDRQPAWRRPGSGGSGGAGSPARVASITTQRSTVIAQSVVSVESVILHCGPVSEVSDPWIAKPARAMVCGCNAGSLTPLIPQTGFTRATSLLAPARRAPCSALRIQPGASCEA